MQNKNMSILEVWATIVPDFELELKKLFETNYFESSIFKEPDLNLRMGSENLIRSIKYAMFSGGKRFRPMLTFASCQVLKKDFAVALPWALAVECIHSYSLIHDDLPCMDNDDERRGMPTVHKKFDEATALLAGDALLTEAFGLLGRHYDGHKSLGSLIQLLAQRSGHQGMVSGQANDLFVMDQTVEQTQVLFIHYQKTAALINAACLGPFLIFGIEPQLTEKFNNLSLILGLMFQLKDDILDADTKSETNLIQSIGDEKTKSIYSTYKDQADSLIKDLSAELNMQAYQELITYNNTRTY